MDRAFTSGKAVAVALALLAGPLAGVALAGPAPGATVPRPSLTTLLTSWSLDPLVLLPLAAVAALYLEGRRRLLRRGLDWPARRTWPFFTGLVVIWLALQSPVEAYDTALFSVHVVQHLLLTMVAAPLLVLGAPVTLALAATAAPVRRRLLRVVHSRPVQVVGHPLVAWALFTLSLYGLYFTPLLDLTLRNVWVHDAVHFHFVTAGVLFWWPVVGIDPSRWRLHHLLRLLFVFLMVPFHAFLGVAILNSERLLAPALGSFDRSWGPAPLEDQRIGGGLMWGIGDIIAVVAVIGIVASWAAYEEKAARREDRRLDLERARRQAPRPTREGPGNP